MEPGLGEKRRRLVLPDRIESIDTGQTAASEEGYMDNFSKVKPAVRQQRQGASDEDQGEGDEKDIH
jgi:hypothetical protein